MTLPAPVPATPVDTKESALPALRLGKTKNAMERGP
jgi:hypothetical protein